MILKDMDSDAGQHQESMVVSSGPSRDAECFSEVPKGVSNLETVIGMLMDKVAQRVTLFASADHAQHPPKAPSTEWLSKARMMAQSLYKREWRRKEKIEKLVRYLDDEMSRVETSIRETESQET